jgi:tRNA threonylcarbamoyladenosine biosynthesis protein TsaE
MQFSYNLADIKLAAQRVWQYASHKRIWAFYAEMGAGKTTFIHALCEILAVHSTIGSPTYSIINEYISEKEGLIYHMDWYRLKGEEEALQAGVEDCLYSGNYCFIEWPEKAASLLPEDCVRLNIEMLDDEAREIRVA